ncbi:hypothetical protein GUJ93_ZPchr0011g28007 [Zizania palustris]|uniref:Uncharacterized protein n=1 Tax=Zizania palustris TaxID=103762 RepID=A0A8J5WDB2_ZIZPA|nr:hypothetical protein GUJ93_ZPchr0011g28007 [Zizania palustris]
MLPSPSFRCPLPPSSSRSRGGSLSSNDRCLLNKESKKVRIFLALRLEGRRYEIRGLVPQDRGRRRHYRCRHGALHDPHRLL